MAKTIHLESVVLTADSAGALTDHINNYLAQDDWRVHSFDTTCVDDWKESKVVFSVLLVREVR